MPALNTSVMQGKLALTEPGTVLLGVLYLAELGSLEHTLFVSVSDWATRPTTQARSGTFT